MPQLTSPVRAEDGFTLIEMVVALSIFTVVLTLLLPTMSVLTRSTSSTDAITAVDTSMRAALLQLTTEIESAGDVTLLCSTNTNPALPACQNNSSSTSGFGVVLYDESAKDTLGGSGNNMTSTGGACYEWKVYSGVLQYRSWAPGGTIPSFSSATPGISIVNTGKSALSPPPFTYDGNSVQLDLFANASSATGKTELETAVTAQGGADGGSSICNTASGTW